MQKINTDKPKIDDKNGKLNREYHLYLLECQVIFIVFDIFMIIESKIIPIFI